MTRLSVFLNRLQDFASKPCVECGEITHRYGELLQEIEHWERRLDQRRVQPGAVIGLRADYSVFSIAAVLALFVRRTIVALIPRDREPEHYLTEAHAVAFLDLQHDGAWEWHTRPPRTHPLLEQLRASADGGLVIFTSGSTGRPKAALQSVERFLYKFSKPRRAFRTLAFLLFDHIAGLDTTFYTLASGGTLILTRRRDPQAIISLIESHKVEVLPTSPSFLRMLCAMSERGAQDLSSLKVITYGSEPMDASTLARVNRRFPEAQISQKYGTTETGSPKTVSQGNDSLWLKIKTDAMEAKVVDGVLWLRGESTILGYLNAPSPLDEAGWYCTGDLVETDGDWIRFRGRVADTINVGGEKVTPAEVEQSILELGFVRDAVVAGAPHPLMGQIVTARVALSQAIEGKEAIKQIRAHCRTRLARHKVPVQIEIDEHLTVTGRQKVQRRSPSA